MDSLPRPDRPDLLDHIDLLDHRDLDHIDRPLLPITFGFVTGIILAGASLVSLPFFLLLLVAGLLLLLPGGLRLVLELVPGRRPWFCLLFLLLGFFRAEVQRESGNGKPIHPPRSEPALVTLTGSVIRAPTSLASLSRIGHQQRSQMVIQPDPSDRHPAFPAVQVAWDGSDLSFAAGDHVRVRGMLSPSRGGMNPPFSEPKVTSPRIHTTQGNVTLLERSPESWRRSVDLFRSRLRSTILDQLPAREAGVLLALLLGEKDAVPSRCWETLQKTGAAHFLAISGLHVGLFCLLLNGALRWMGFSPRARGCILIPLVWGYAWWTGLSQPVLRAAIMTSALLLGHLLRRRSDGLNSLALAGLVLLFVTPSDVFRAGFQLSFIAVAALILAGRTAPLKIDAEQETATRRRPFLTLLRPFASCFRASVVATVATAPLISHHFHLLTALSPLSSLLALPVLVLVLPLSAIAAMATWWFPDLSEAYFLLRGIGILLAGLLTALEWLEKTNLYLRVPGPGVVGAWLSYGILFAGLVHRQCLGRFAVIGLAVLLVLSLSPLPGKENHELRVTALAVGHGGAIVAELPGSQILVYDCGSTPSSGIASRAITRYLLSRRILTVHHLVLSHGDADHLNGAPGLARSLKVKRVFVSSRFGDSRAAEEQVLSELITTGSTIQRVAAGDIITVAGPTEIRVLSPPAPERAPLFNICTTPGSNEDSLVLRIELGKTSLLIPGDLTGLGLESLLRESDLEADVLFVPHHGSSQLALAELIRRVNPEVAIVSAARTDRREDLMKVATKFDIPVFSTDEVGAVCVLGEHEGFKVWSLPLEHVERKSYTKEIAAFSTQHWRPSRRRISSQFPRSSTSSHSVPECRGSSKAGS